MVRHQCYDTNHFITVKCIYYRTLIVPNLIIKYDSLPSFSFAKIQPVHVRRRHFYWSQNNWLYYAQIGTYFYGETLNALYKENVIPLIHDL